MSTRKKSDDKNKNKQNKKVVVKTEKAEQDSILDDDGDPLFGAVLEDDDDDFYNYHDFDQKVETLEDLKTVLTNRMSSMEKKLTTILGRLVNDVAALRNENAKLKNQIGVKSLQFVSKNSVLPANPFENVDDFLKFVDEVATSDEKHAHLVSELSTISCNGMDKYIRTCWRKLITDKVAEHFCWRGTAVKKSIKEMDITFAIKIAFRQKYEVGEDDETFDKVCQKYFQYAHDRQTKLTNYHINKLELPPFDIEGAIKRPKSSSKFEMPPFDLEAPIKRTKKSHQFPDFP